MSMNPEDVFDVHIPTPADIADIVKSLREDRKWSQATLAELSNLTERTIQRVENAEPSSLDTRRAIAGAFQLGSLDIFEKPFPFPNAEKMKKLENELEKTTVLISLTKVDNGRTLRTMIEGAGSYAMDEIGEHSDAARENFAAMVEYLSDYNDIRDSYSATQRLDVDRDISELLNAIHSENSAVAAGVRHARIRTKNEAPGQEPLDWTNTYFVLCQKQAVPENIRVPKAIRFG